jgi:hypothetical protein
MYDGILHTIVQVQFRSSGDAKENIKFFWNRFKDEYDSILLIDLELEEHKRRIGSRLHENPATAHLYGLTADGEANQILFLRLKDSYALLRKTILETGDVPVLVLNGVDPISVKVRQAGKFIMSTHFHEASQSNR